MTETNEQVYQRSQMQSLKTGVPVSRNLAPEARPPTYDTASLGNRQVAQAGLQGAYGPGKSGLAALSGSQANQANTNV